MHLIDITTNSVAVIKICSVKGAYKIYVLLKAHSLDGNYESNYAHIPSNEPGFIYNTLVYANDNVDGNSAHNLTMIAVGEPTNGDGDNSFIMFDYSLYT